MLASERMNHYLKCGHLQWIGILTAAQDALNGLWEKASLAGAAIQERCRQKCAAAMTVRAAAESDRVFDDLAGRRLRLQRDLQGPALERRPEAWST
jgi:hypothetical protein